MRVARLDDRVSPFAVASAPPFRHKEWRTPIRAAGAPGRRSRQRHYPTHSVAAPTDRLPRTGLARQKRQRFANSAGPPPV